MYSSSWQNKLISSEWDIEHRNAVRLTYIGSINTAANNFVQLSLSLYLSLTICLCISLCLFVSLYISLSAFVNVLFSVCWSCLCISLSLSDCLYVCMSCLWPRWWWRSRPLDPPAWQSPDHPQTEPAQRRPPPLTSPTCLSYLYK